MRNFISKKIIMFMPSIEGGGVEKNFFIVANYLCNFNKISVITISNIYRNKFNRKIEFISFKSLFWNRLSRKLKYFFAFILLIKKLLLEKEKIVFCFQANIYAILICKIFCVKIIVRSNSAPFGWSKNSIKKKIFTIVLKLADKIMVNSFEFKKDLKKEFQVNSISIYNPLDKKRIIDQSKKKIRKIFNRNTLKIINVGRFVDQKDQLTLLKALNEIKNKINFNAIIIGQGVLKDKLKEFIIKNKLGNLVKLLNFKKNPYQYIVKADIFILSSSFEGLPNVLLEALVLNKFIISSDCRTGPKEILLNGIGGDLFKVGDYKKLAELIIDYKKNKKIKLKKLKLARKNLDRFEYELNLKRYLNLVRSII